MSRSPEQARRWVEMVLANPEKASRSSECLRVLLKGEPVVIDELAVALSVSLSTVYLVVADLKRAGWPVETLRPNVVQVTGEPAPVSTSTSLVPVRGKARGSSAAFLRPGALGLPALGQVLRVTMLAEDEAGEPVAVLHDQAGARFFARLEPAS